jgi:hypothetical protein
MRILSRRDVFDLLTLRDCIAAVEGAFRLHAEGHTLGPWPAGHARQDRWLSHQGGRTGGRAELFCGQDEREFPRQSDRLRAPDDPGHGRAGRCDDRRAARADGLRERDGVANRSGPIDPEPEFLFVPADQVLEAAQRHHAIPYDIPNVELGHHGLQCSFDAFIERYKLTDPALTALALIVRGADTAQRELTPESPGLYALATGFQATSKDDFENMARQLPAYDALYAFCRANADAPPERRA